MNETILKSAFFHIFCVLQQFFIDEKHYDNCIKRP